MKTAVKSLQRSVSPPPSKRRKLRTNGDPIPNGLENPSLATIEAGEAKIRTHLEYFAMHLREAARPVRQDVVRLDVNDFAQLYQRNDHDQGNHFVIHQHNHPVAGVHYDLRLQFSKTSACSWAIPYGLPGNANSRRQGRKAVETRVHTLWNNLIESASHSTGSLLIWDTGEYEVLPRRVPALEATTDDESSSPLRPTPGPVSHEQENQKLIRAFRGRFIRLRLHGTRLPPGYTITLRLPLANDTVKAHPGSSKPRGRRKRHRVSLGRQLSRTAPETDSDNDSPSTAIPSQLARPDQGSELENEAMDNAAGASDDDTAREAEKIRLDNAYTGAHNTIGSIHQRHWYLSLDRPNSGFVQQSALWVRDGIAGFEPFYVQGAEVERSVVTGRLSCEVMADEGVEGFQPRKLWRPIMT